MQSSKWVIGSYIAAAAAVGLALGASASLAQGGAQPAAASAAAPKAKAEAPHGHPGERHPALHRALRDLLRAKEALDKAPPTDNIGGHREKAAKLAQQAIDEINAALASSKPKAKK
ncbi:MAG: hypothetical protein FJZ00_11350 [Candidatus Sericytochromatia bacterium]|uniref:Metal-binding protein SmbP n=1 Tax=Candidatus Tanganyikabacteria bacterium TaxID=2961651 RepID=A0A937X470_9BACT|nr:hypothetical protein [Candidatus Tanganyikabacteria bacterium]